MCGEEGERAAQREVCVWQDDACRTHPKAMKRTMTCAISNDKNLDDVCMV